MLWDTKEHSLVGFIQCLGKRLEQLAQVVRAHGIAGKCFELALNPSESVTELAALSAGDGER